MIFPALFHTASTLSGSLRSPPSPRGEGFVSGIPPSPSNLRPFGAPPSIGRRERPREPLSLEGAAERSEAGLASFWGGEAPSSLLSPLGKGDRVSGARVLVYRLLETIFPDLFHTASTLSGSLRSPPSPRGEGFVSGTTALSQMPRLHSVQTKTALRGRALQSGFWFYYSTVTDFARFLGLSTSFPLLIEV